MTRIPVAGPPPYDVVVGGDALDAVADRVGPARAMVVHSPEVAHVADRVAATLAEASRFEVPGGEAAKDLRVAERAWAELGRGAFTRTDVVVGVGGGAVTDLAGFVAATWLRGVPVVHVPTTLLGMVDAAVGGKTAVNTEAGKNLVGAFHQPSLVAVDPSLLETLPQPEYVSGLAEVVKAGFVADPAILDLVEADPAAVLARKPLLVAELVERAIRVKVDVVSADPVETGRREVLNYGHTFAHAIERDAGFGAWRHGDAVAVGLCYAAAVSRRRPDRPLDCATADRHRQVLSALGLPTSYDGAAWPRLREAMRVDKKSRGRRLRFVVLEALARPAVVDAVDEELLESAYAEVAS